VPDVSAIHPAPRRQIVSTIRELGIDLASPFAERLTRPKSPDASIREGERMHELGQALNSDIIDQLVDRGFQFVRIDSNHAIYIQQDKGLRCRVPLDYRPKRFWFLEYEAMLSKCDGDES